MFSRMTVCEICGHKGFSKLLIHCAECQIIAVHRYCMDGPSTIDDEEVFWSCEDCVPRVAKPTESCRKSERVSTKMDREALRRKARRKWRNNLSLLEAEKIDNVRDSTLNVTSNTSNVSHNWKDEDMAPQLTQVPISFNTNASPISERKDDSLHDNDDENGTVPVIQQKNDLLTWNVVRKMRTKATVVLTREREGDQSSYAGVEDQVVMPEKKVAFEHQNLTLGKDKNDKSCDEVGSRHLGEVNDTSHSQAAKQSSDYANKESEVVEGEIDSFLDHKVEDVQSCCTVKDSLSPRKKRKLVIEMEYYDADDTPYIPAEPSLLKSSDDDALSSKPQVNSGDHAPPADRADHILALPPLAEHVPSQPIIDIIWRGGCGISNNVDPISFELQAHVSNKASPVVYGAASALPKQIDFEIVSKRYAWPKSFEKSPPTAEIIGLYFFPASEQDEILYENLLVKMVDRQLMLTSHINNLDLLVFGSQELPEEDCRFQRKYYLWGVFRQRQETMVPIKPQATQINKSGVYQNPRDSHHKTLNNFPKTAHSENLDRPKPVCSSQRYNTQPSQRYNTQPDRYQHCNSRNWRNRHRKPRLFSKHQAESDGYAYDNKKSSYHAKVRYQNNRGYSPTWMRSVQKDSYHSKGHYQRYRGHDPIVCTSPGQKYD